MRLNRLISYILHSGYSRAIRLGEVIHGRNRITGLRGGIIMITAVLQLRSQFDKIILHSVYDWNEEENFIFIVQKVGETFFYLRYAKDDVLFWQIEVNKEEE